MLGTLFAKFSWDAFKAILFSPIGLVGVVVVTWFASSIATSWERRAECKVALAAVQTRIDNAVAEARKFDEGRLHMARVQAARDAQENAERAAADKKEIEDYAKSLEERLKNNPAANCALGPDARSLGVRR